MEIKKTRFDCTYVYGGNGGGDGVRGKKQRVE